MKIISVSILVLGILTPLYTHAQTIDQTQTETPATSTTQSYEVPVKQSQPRIFYGGGFGLGFGDVEYYEFWPIIGVNITRALGVGVQLLYRHRKDKRYQQDLTTDDYGATLFGRYRFPGPFYLQAEYEYLDYEYRTSAFTNSTKRDQFSSFLAGGGVSQPVGRNTSFYATVLYNFSYDQEDSPYDTPWVVRFGVGIGF